MPESLDKNFSKLICGAANTNHQQIELLSLVYSLAGIGIIDISSTNESIIAAEQGINKAREFHEKYPKFFPNFNKPLIMVSLNAGDDLHFRKARIDFSKCNNCFSCISICPANALKRVDDKLNFNSNSCYGCKRCVNACLSQAISIDQFNEYDNINDILGKVNAIEVHTGSKSLDEMKVFLENNAYLLRETELFSLSINSSLFSPPEFVNYTQSLLDFICQKINKKIIIQVDGTSMRANNQSSSCLQTITYANILANSNIDAYIQVAGGVNHLTRKYINLFNIKISGISYGTFARKIILPYIDNVNTKEFLNDLSIVRKCVNIASNLAI